MNTPDFSIDSFLRGTDRQNMPEGSVVDDALRLIYQLGRAEKWRHTCETGTGRTTVLLSNLSSKHVVFALERSGNLSEGGRGAEKAESVEYVLGPSQRTLPAYRFTQELDFAMIDGPHAYPFPDLEYFYLYPHVRRGGWLVVDDVHIPTINNLHRFLCEEPMWRFHARKGNTAFFQRTDTPTFDPYGDGWWNQAYNQNHINDHKPWAVRAKILLKKALGRG